MVRPDIDSNVESIGPRPFHKYGMPANAAISNQAAETTASPSTRRMLSTASSAALPPACRIRWPIADVSTQRDRKALRVAEIAVEQRERERGQEHQPEHANDDADDVRRLGRAA